MDVNYFKERGVGGSCLSECSGGIRGIPEALLPMGRVAGDASRKLRLKCITEPSTDSSGKFLNRQWENHSFSSLSKCGTALGACRPEGGEEFLGLWTVTETSFQSTHGECRIEITNGHLVNVGLPLPRTG